MSSYHCPNNVSIEWNKGNQSYTFSFRACLMRLNEFRRVLYNLNEIMKEKERMEAQDENCLQEIEE